MGQGFHYFAGDGDGVQITFHGSHGAAFQGAAVHNAGVQFHFAQQIGEAAVPYGVVVGIGFYQANAGLYGVYGRAPVSQNLYGCFNANLTVGAGCYNHPSASKTTWRESYASCGKQAIKKRPSGETAVLGKHMDN